MSGVGLEVEGVSVELRGKRVLADVSTAVDPGRVLAVVGASGSGKTSLLRVVAGLLVPDTGEVRIGGRSQAGVPPHQRGIGFVFQDYALFPHRSVLGNVTFGLEMAGWERRRRRDRALVLLRRVGLAEAADRRVTDLSGGEQQRVALARALAPEPGLLLLDEPFGALDAALSADLMGELSALVEEIGVTAVHVTHDLVEAAAVSHRLAVMADGRMLEQGGTSELVRGPATVEVARFLGHQVVDATAVDGHIIAGGGDQVLVVADAALAGLDLTQGARLTVVVSPSALVVSNHDPCSRVATSLTTGEAGGAAQPLAASRRAQLIGLVPGVDAARLRVDLGGLELAVSVGPGHPAHGWSPGSDVWVACRRDAVAQGLVRVLSAT